MNNFIIHIVIVIVPLIFSNTLHMFIVKKDFFNFLTIPISAKLFGKNKTWRGFIFVGICNTIFSLAVINFFNLNIETPMFLGFTLGIAYMCSELPNSFMKRRLGIKSGEKHKTQGILFSMFDKMDSAFGVSVTYFSLGYTDFKTAVFLFLFSSFTHMFFSKILVVLKIKKSF